MPLTRFNSRDKGLTCQCGFAPAVSPHALARDGPALLDDIRSCFGDEFAEQVSAWAAQVAKHQEGNWLSRWWRCTVAFAGAVSIAWAIWLATDHWPVIYTLRVARHFFRRVVLSVIGTSHRPALARDSTV